MQIAAINDHKRCHPRCCLRSLAIRFDKTPERSQLSVIIADERNSAITFLKFDLAVDEGG